MEILPEQTVLPMQLAIPWQQGSGFLLWVNHEALVFKLRQLGLGGAFLSILIEFLTGRVQRVVVDGQYSAWRNVVSSVP